MRSSIRPSVATPAFRTLAFRTPAFRSGIADRALLLVEGIAIAKLIMLAIAYPFRRGR